MPRIRTRDSSTALLDDLQPVAPVAVEPPTPKAQPPIRTAAPEPLTPDPLPPDAVDVLQREEAEQRTAEQLFIRKVDGQEWEPDQDWFIRRRHKSQSEVHENLQRVKRYRALQRTAGSGADRADAARLAEQTAARLADEGPAIVAKIADLQQQLTDLEKAAQDAAAAHDRRSQAVDALRDPIHLGEPHHSRYEACRRRWEKDFGIPSRVARQEAQGMAATAGLDPTADAEKILSFSQTHKGLGHVVDVQILEGHAHPTAFFRQRVPADENGPRPYVVRDQRTIRVDAGTWQGFAAELRQQAAVKLQRAEELERDGQPLKAELDAMLAALVPE